MAILGDATKKDCISSLPSDITSEILSRLPTADAVKTSVLSSKWKDKWIFVYNLHIDERNGYFRNANADATLDSVVTRLLLRIPFKLRRFHLELDKEFCHSGMLGTWISHVIGRDVQNLYVSARNYERLDSVWCFSGWTLLTNLTLVMSCSLKVPAGHCFPRLKTLYLSGGSRGDIRVMFTKVPGTGRRVLSFPVLKNLLLSNCEFLDVSSIEIQAPELLSFGSYWKNDFKKNHDIRIDAPKLQLLDLAEQVPFDLYILRASSAVICVSFLKRLEDKDSTLRAHKLLSKFSNLKNLRIHGQALEALLRLKPQSVFPEFTRLKELEVYYHIATKDVLELLHGLPPLQSLTICIMTLIEYESPLTPKIVSLLNEVKLLNYSETKGQNDLIWFLLENAKSLCKMTITVRKDVGRPFDAVRQYLSNLKVNNSSCELVVLEQKGRNVWP